MKNLYKIILLIFLTANAFGQSAGEGNTQLPTEEFLIGLEYRPRTELRYGYRQLPTDTSNAAFSTSHRARITLTFKRDNFLFHTSIQDIRVWGDENDRNEKGHAQFYEIYVEPQIGKSLLARVGRQSISYDNQRLFSENNWRQTGARHEAVRFIYKKPKLQVDFIGAFNQNEARLFETNYNISWNRYKVLLANFIKYELSSRVSLTAINFTDGYQQPGNPEATHFKYTSGGRIEYTQSNLYLTFASYYQYGKINTGEKHRAYYYEPELRYKTSNFHAFRLGAQVFSGDGDIADGTSRAFLAQFGSANRHNGRMDYTSRQISTNNHEGIVNPYLAQDFRLNEKLTLSWDSHILATQVPLKIHEQAGNQVLDKFYGWENDFRLRYKPNSYTDILVSYNFLIAGETLEYLPEGKGRNRNNLPSFAFVQITWTPELLRLKNPRGL